MKRPSPWRVMLGAVVAVEAALLFFTFWLYADARYPFTTALETRPLTSAHGVVVHLADVIDTVNIFYGTPELGRDPLAEPREDGRAETSFRPQLTFDSGVFNWILLRDQVQPDDPLCTLGADGLPSDDRKQYLASLQNGVLNFFYDLSGNEAAFLHNWSTVGVQEQQLSPLLPWTKHIGFAIVSRWDPDHCAALSYIRRGRPNFVVFGPPLPRHSPLHFVTRGPGIHALPAGLHRLTDRLSMAVYRDRDGTSAALLVRSGERRVVVCGASGLDPVTLVETMERLSGARVTGFIGATGYQLGVEEPRVVAALQALHRTHPGFRIAPGFATSSTALGMISRIFGSDNVQAALLGGRIHLDTF